MTRTTIRAAAAALILIVITAGLPLLLVAVHGNPIPEGLPTADQVRGALTRPDDGTLALDALAWSAWLCWAWWTGSLIVDIIRRARGRAPLRGTLPVSRLVAAVAAVAVAAPAGAAVAAPAEPATQVVAPSTADQAQSDPGAAVIEVHSGDTLWGLSAEYLGDGARYPELFDASDDYAQPDGRRLTDPDRIWPEWVITLPNSEPPAVDLTAPVPPAAPAPTAGPSPAGTPAPTAAPTLPAITTPLDPSTSAADAAAITTPLDPTPDKASASETYDVAIATPLRPVAEVVLLRPGADPAPNEGESPVAAAERAWRTAAASSGPSFTWRDAVEGC